MSWAQKSRVTAIFGVGLFACVASVIRLVYSVGLARIQTIDTAHQLESDREGLWGYALQFPQLFLSLLIFAQFR